MVEKVSEVSVSAAVNIDSSSDDSSALLELIDKKKKQKQGGGDSLPNVLLLPEMLLRAIHIPAAKIAEGGMKKAEQHSAGQRIPASFSKADDFIASAKGTGLRRPPVPAVVNPGVSNSLVAKSTPAKGEQARAQNHQDTAVSAKASPLPGVTLVEKNPPLTPAVPSVPVNAPRLAMTDRRQQHKEEAGEIRPTIQSGRAQEYMSSQPREIKAQNKHVPATLQQLKTLANAADSAAKPGAESQTLEVNYAFQRWSGDHSVRVSVPTQAARDGNITLLPSDARAADLLARNMSHLTGLTPELLQPRQEQDEQQQRRQHQHQQDEEQE